MKYIISEGQYENLIENYNPDTVKIISHIRFKRQIENGDDPHIDKPLMTNLKIKYNQGQYYQLLRVLKNFLGDSALPVAIKKTSKTYNTVDYPNLTGGYDFSFNIDIKSEEDYNLYLNIEVLPNGTVYLFVAETELDLSDAIRDEDIAWEIESEIEQLVYDILSLEVSNYTGYQCTIEKINFDF